LLSKILIISSSNKSIASSNLLFFSLNFKILSNAILSLFEISVLLYPSVSLRDPPPLKTAAQLSVEAWGMS